MEHLPWFPSSPASRPPISFGLGLTALYSALWCISTCPLRAQSVSFAGASPSVNFGSVNLCAPAKTTPAPCSETLTLTYKVTASGTLGTPKVLTLGAPDLDFTLASGSTCSGAVTAATTCTVNVKFAPKLPGSRPGAVEIIDSSGVALATTPISGAGSGAQISFSPGTTIPIPVTGFPSDPVPPPYSNYGSDAIAVDGAGDVFLTNPVNGDDVYSPLKNTIVELPAGGGAQVTIGSGWNLPSGLAIDGAGDLLVADYGNARVVKFPLGGGAPTTVGSGFTAPGAVAVAGSGDVFIADDGNNSVYKVAFGSGTQTLIYSAPSDTTGTGLTTLSGQIAANAAGDVFFAISTTIVDPTTSVQSQTASVLKIPAGGGSPTTVFSETLSPLSSSTSVENAMTQSLGPLGLAVGASGDLYVASFLQETELSGEPTYYGESQSQTIVDVPAGTSTQTAVFSQTVSANWVSGVSQPPTTGIGPLQMALDGSGDLLLADSYYYNVFELARSQPPVLNYGAIAFGAIDDILPLTLINTGTTTLSVAPSISGPSYLISSATPSDCLTAIAPDRNCTLQVEFSPATVGLNNETLTLHTNAQANPVVLLQGMALNAMGAPVFSEPTGVYVAPLSVLITAPDGAAIYYTTDGSAPSASNPSAKLYTGAITFGGAGGYSVLSAVAISGGKTSPIALASYTIVSPGDVINFSQGFYQASGPMKLNGSARVDSANLQLTNCEQFEAASAFYATPVNIQTFSTIFTFQLTNPEADGFTFAIQNVGPEALGDEGGALGYAPIGKSVALKFDLHNDAGEGPDSSGLYTDGASPTTPAINLSPTGIDLHSGHPIVAQIAYDGTNLTVSLSDPISVANWFRSFPVDIPAIVGADTAYVGFTGATGLQTANQAVSSWTYVSGSSNIGTIPVVDNSPNSELPVGALTLNGSASFAGTALRLTDGKQFEAGSAFTFIPFNIEDFGTQFTFQLTNPNADGFGFTVQAVGAKVVGEDGGGLGYAGIGNSVELKFDLHNNAGEGNDSTGVYINGAMPTTPAVDLTGTGIDLHSGHIFMANITYGTIADLGMNVTLTDTVTSATWSHFFPVNIPEVIGTDYAYVGFTGATGTETATQDILTWTIPFAAPGP